MIDPNSNSHQNKGNENGNMKFKTQDSSLDRKPNSVNTSVSSIQLSVSSANKSREETHSRSNSNGHQPQQSVNQNIPPNNENYNVESWVKRDGPQKLYESLKRLNLDLNAINRINLSALTVDEISLEKKRVKNELKRYDTAFSAVFKRIPSREEKEPMRPLYIYYKKLKQTIGRTDKPNPKSNTVVQKSSTTSGVTPIAIPEKNQRLLGSMNLLQEKENKATTISSQADKKLDSSFEYNLSKDATKELSFEPKMNNFFNQGLPSHKHTNSKSNVSAGFNYEQARKELEDLKQNRAKLRDRLHSYQVDFTKNNNRKIKYHKDIVPVENEYKRYKEIKQEIQRLENLLGVA